MVEMFGRFGNAQGSCLGWMISESYGLVESAGIECGMVVVGGCSAD
jgi:hypothetical protein